MGLGVSSSTRESSRLRMSAVVSSALCVWGPCSCTAPIYYQVMHSISV